MTDDPVSLLVTAIRDKTKVTFRMRQGGGAVFVFCPYVLYDQVSTGILMLSGVTEYAPLRVAVTDIDTRSLAATSRNFKLDPAFNLDEAEYSEAHAIITRD
jgi:hypothetical protein